MCACSESGSRLDPDEPNFTDEKLRNGGFEMLDAAGDPADWRVIDTNPGGSISVDGDTFLFGQRALTWRIEAAAGDGREFFIIQNGIPGDALTPGKTYAFTGSYMFDDLGDIGFMQAVRGPAGGDLGFDNFSERSKLPSEPGAWEEFSFEFTIPSDAVLPATWEVNIDVLKFTGRALTVSVDGVSLHEKTSLLPRR